MEKNLIAAALVTAILSANAFADDGKIDFVGSITDDACTVINNTTNPLTVTLGTVSSKAFTGSGSTAAPTEFTIALTNCPDSVTSAKVKFDGDSGTSDNTVLALTGAGGANVASGVGIQLTDATNAVVPLFVESSAYPLSEGPNDLKFTARYYAIANTVGAGSANATSNFTIIYN